MTRLFCKGRRGGVTFTNVATLYPAVADASITYRSSNEEVATVDNSGKVSVNASKAGTATITASYAGNDNFSASNASYTITVEKVYQNIAELKAAYSSSEVIGKLRLHDAQVTAVDGNNKYLQDATGALVVDDVSSFGYHVGDKLNGVATVTYKENNTTPEITSFSPVGDIAQTPDTTTPVEMAIEDVNERQNLCKYIVVKAVKLIPGSSIGIATATNGNNTINVYKENEHFTNGQYDLTGIIKVSDKGNELLVHNYAPDFVIDENEDHNDITAGENATVTINRTFNNGAWNTLVLPFAMTAEQLLAAFGSDAKFAKFTGTTRQADGTYTLNFSPVTATEANTPVFVWGAQSKTFTVEGVTIVKAAAASVPSGAAFSFSGSYDKTLTESGDWYVSSDNKVYQAIGSEPIKPTRAVFRPVTDIVTAKALSFGFNSGQTTGISAINADAKVGNNMISTYNLAGQPIGKAYKGIVLRNGKKYIRK